MDKEILITPQGEALSGTPWTAYPRPQMRRESYVNLNGIWDFAVTDSPALPADYPMEIQVPFCPESRLSGIETHFDEGSSLFYRKKLTLPADFSHGRVLLHIGAADQAAEVYVNQTLVGTHVGGYEAFHFDITDFLQAENELVIRVTDDLRSHVLPYGKQVQKPGGMWYTPVSGIWQTVWAECVPETHIQSLHIDVTDACAAVTVEPALDGTVTCQGVTYPLSAGQARITPENPHLWWPEDPYLYHFTVDTGEDRVNSYFALRTLEVKTVKGCPRLCLNGKPYFFHGLLDQGYWPDGLFTPAAPACYEADILAMKHLGFNMLRKHIKVEPEQFYYDCDRLGMVVFQDMVNNGDYQFLRDTVAPTFLSQQKDDAKMHPDPETRAAFLSCMEATVKQLKNHPCICYWTIFNEAWGQFDSAAAYEKLKALDSSRFIDATSGWYRGTVSDVESLHIYFDMWHRLQPSNKPLVLSEFGGFTHGVQGHIYNTKKAYGYGTCKTLQALTHKIRQVYLGRVIPAAKLGLCAAVYTQVSDVEDEINGLLTYDRKVCKVSAPTMQRIAAALQEAMK